jgi:hypothetical protein
MFFRRIGLYLKGLIVDKKLKMVVKTISHALSLNIMIESNKFEGFTMRNLNEFEKILEMFSYHSLRIEIFNHIFENAFALMVTTMSWNWKRKETN